MGELLLKPLFAEFLIAFVGEVTQSDGPRLSQRFSKGSVTKHGANDWRSSTARIPATRLIKVPDGRTMASLCCENVFNAVPRDAISSHPHDTASCQHA
jgi:hypothetical protein